VLLGLQEGLFLKALQIGLLIGSVTRFIMPRTAYKQY